MITFGCQRPSDGVIAVDSSLSFFYRTSLALSSHVT